MNIVASNENPKRRKGRAPLRVIYRNENRTLWVRFQPDPERAQIVAEMLAEYNRIQANRKRGA